MKLIVGLGNPGSKYVGTRHNVGFGVVGELARRFVAESPRIKFEAEFCDVHVGGTKVVLVTPITYMNLSGRSIRQFVDFFDVELEDLVVVCDDLNLDLGQLRWRKKVRLVDKTDSKTRSNTLGLRSSHDYALESAGHLAEWTPRPLC